ncbi:Beta-galactosidase [Halotydeus destructor]|nr:Beta-galactosidase [Halotydeus destructor]
MLSQRKSILATKEKLRFLMIKGISSGVRMSPNQASLFSWKISLTSSRWLTKSGYWSSCAQAHIFAPKEISEDIPYWLKRDNPSMKIRTSDPSYLKLVDRYLSNVLPLITPLLYSNGGPVIMVQVENEYGASFCDLEYIGWLRDAFRQYLVDDVILFATDPVDLNELLAVQRQFEPKGPFVVSEAYTGGLQYWSTKPETRDTVQVVKTLKELLDLGASVNLFPFHGGTNFGYKNAAVGGDSTTSAITIFNSTLFQPLVTSYDFDAPISEAGDLTEKYKAIRALLGQIVQLPAGDLTKYATKLNLGSVHMHLSLTLSDIMLTHSKRVDSEFPVTFDELQVDGGYVIYRTSLDFKSRDPSQLTILGLNDRAQVLVDGRLVGTLSRANNIFSTSLNAVKGSELIIVVENQGRFSFDFDNIYKPTKGIIGNVTLGSKTLTNWTHYYDLNLGGNRVDSVKTQTNQPPKLQVPAVYAGSFVVPPGAEGQDTFLRLDGWGKGVAFVNGINIGRYWPDEGPQVTLYVPHVWLRPKSVNYIHLFETECAPCQDRTTCFVSLSDKHVIRGETAEN